MPNVEYLSHEMLECADLENDGDMLEQRRQHRSGTGRVRIHPYMCSEEQQRWANLCVVLSPEIAIRAWKTNAVGTQE